ncbi:hypothetical protein ACH4LA_07980 [Streptomyces albogriseolus]|uniref:hypothetical protein n=1 Tax=Streptomyces albogriseolus TaxID=1887 RepID=UPI003797CE5C
MSFSVSFNPAAPSAAVAIASVSLEAGDGYESLVMEACSALSDAGGSRFHIDGFGCDEWPLDVAYEEFLDHDETEIRRIVSTTTQSSP